MKIKLPHFYIKKLWRYRAAFWLTYTLIFILSAFLVAWAIDFAYNRLNPAKEADYGVTYSVTYAKSLGFDPVELFSDLTTELGVKKVRLPVYWNEVEKDGRWDFSLYDRILEIARQNNTQVLLVIGYKVPRWPECYPPENWDSWEPTWQKLKILELLEKEVRYFQNQSAIKAWQVENEPLLDFGICTQLGRDFLKKEVDLVKSIDTRPVVLTDSGELGLWITALQYSDTMGTSLYRIIWNPLFGYFRYPFPPLYYNLKAHLTQAVFAPHSQGVIVSEVQAEPWNPNKSVTQSSGEEMAKLFSLKDFQDIVEFTKNTRLKEQYLWGVEWWYYMKKLGYPEYWEYAHSLFTNQL